MASMFVGIMVLAIIANTVQVSKAKRFSFRQIVSVAQIFIYSFLLLNYTASGYSTAFSFWSTFALFTISFIEGIEIGLLIKGGDSGIQREADEGKLLMAINNSIAVVLPFVLFLISTSMITGFPLF